ncbi:hypothetical protein ACSLOG_27685 [Escherichia coli]|uniref:hypothetical protein n=1 Tax=Escherichia coli TaxID=562 RepID=UPI003EDF4E89
MAEKYSISGCPILKEAIPVAKKEQARNNIVLYGIACGMLVPVSVSGIAVLIVGTLEMLLLMGFR